MRVHLQVWKLKLLVLVSTIYLRGERNGAKHPISSVVSRIQTCSARPQQIFRLSPQPLCLDYVMHSWKPHCAGRRRVAADDLLWPWRVRRWGDCHCKPQVLWCGLSSHWLLSPHCSKLVGECSPRVLRPGDFMDVKIKILSRNSNTTEGWVSWSYLRIVEQLSSICSACSFPNWDTADFCRQNAQSLTILCLYNVFSIVWEDILLRRSVMTHYIDIESSFHHICSLYIFSDTFICHVSSK